MYSSLFSLSKKNALVTGASRGIGYSLALGLASFGAAVTAVARTKNDLEKLSRDAEKKGFPIKINTLDVMDLKKVVQFIEKNEPFQILVNNAGTNKLAMVLDVKEETFDYLVDLNLKSAFFIARTVAKKLIQKKQAGSIINISSQMGHVGAPLRSVYCATKHAVEGFTKAMAWEWGKYNIRINTVCPTFIETPMTKPMFEDKNFIKEVKQKIAFGRIGKIEELVGPVVFLASDAASLITGSALMVDGGWTAQ